jgi:hypothetical protein
MFVAMICVYGGRMQIFARWIVFRHCRHVCSIEGRTSQPHEMRCVAPF